jgi:mono/diheme cytochrome c family protein
MMLARSMVGASAAAAGAWRRIFVRVLGTSLAVAVVLGTPSRASGLDGAVIYARRCERCHGVTGRGDGPDARLFLTPPRDLQSVFLARYGTEDLVRRIRSGIPLELALDPAGLRDRAGEVEAIAAHLERLATVNWRRVEEGIEVYVDRCEVCHGRSGAPDAVPGSPLPARDLSDPAFQRATTDAALAAVIEHGHGGMPAPLAITAKERLGLIAFVRLLSPGYTLYDRYCATCHGDDGRGSGTFGEEAGRPTVVFDRAYFRRHDPEHVRAAVWHMLATARPAMPHLGRQIRDDEARAVVDYLKRAP